jgi:uncharacterized protein (TIGR02246 family)
MRHATTFLFLAALTFAATPDQDIRAVLDQQSAAWNRGDIPAFMEGYERTPKLTFVGKSLTHGYDEVLESYKKRYPTPDAMGKLRFEILDIQLLGSDYANVVGRFHLERNTAGGGNADGIFTLLFKKTPKGWKVIQDHTS